MSRRQKLIDRVQGIPPPKDLTWEELVSFLGYYGYELDSSGGGSHHKFRNPSTGESVNVARPHPDNIVKPYYIKQIVAALASKTTQGP
jgi:predicted RNA binding protein YcfA (HicA-like mRNA interferase family)